LNDSSVIISALETYRLDPSHSLKDILKFYEPMESIEVNKKTKEYPNRHFVMLYSDKITDGKDVSQRK
jgi:hypothetical protein